MKKASLYSMVLILSGIAFGCNEEAAKGLRTSCGDGVLGSDEICDGSLFANSVKVCPEGLVLRDESAFACTTTCGLDFSKACAAPKCGDGVLSGGEICDENKFKDGAKVCPKGMTELPNPEYRCTEMCTIDYAKACTAEGVICGDSRLDDVEVCDGNLFQPNAKQCPGDMVELPNPIYGCTDRCQVDYTNACISSICGDDKVTGLEACDGNLFANDAKVCPEGQKSLLDRDLFRCNNCMIDAHLACIPEDARMPALYISEIDIQSDGNNDNHFYIEIGNLGADTALDECRIAGVKLTEDNTLSDDYVFEYDLVKIAEKLGNTPNNSSNVLGICHETRSGWLKEQFNETSMTKEECDIFLNWGYAASEQCDEYCESIDWPDDCVKACTAFMDDIYNNYYKCLNTAEYILLDSACDFYIPSDETTISSVLNRTTYNPQKLWGIALVCGNSIHDMISLEYIEKGGERMCKVFSDLSSIVNTGDQIMTSGYLSCDSKTGLLSRQPRQTYGVAECGYCDVN